MLSFQTKIVYTKLFSKLYSDGAMREQRTAVNPPPSSRFSERTFSGFSVARPRSGFSSAPADSGLPTGEGRNPFLTHPTDALPVLAQVDFRSSYSPFHGVATGDGHHRKPSPHRGRAARAPSPTTRKSGHRADDHRASAGPAVCEFFQLFFKRF